MNKIAKLTRVEATPELLSEMEMLQVYGGDVVVNPNYSTGCSGTIYVYCDSKTQCTDNCNPNKSHCNCVYNSCIVFEKCTD